MSEGQIYELCCPLTTPECSRHRESGRRHSRQRIAMTGGFCPNLCPYCLPNWSMVLTLPHDESALVSKAWRVDSAKLRILAGGGAFTVSDSRSTLSDTSPMEVGDY